MRKGQFFVLGMIIALVTIVSLINAISIPYSLSVSVTENQRINLEKYDSFKSYFESAINEINDNWDYFSIKNRIKFEINNNCSVSREKPWSMAFDIEDNADKDSIRLAGENGELTSQVEWINSTTKTGKIYFYDNITIYYNIIINRYI